MSSDSNFSRSFLARLFGRRSEAAVEEETREDGITVERVEAETVDPKAPLPRAETEAEDTSDGPPPSPGGRIAGWFGRRKRAIVNFFIPQPVLVPAQLVTPEISLGWGGKPRSKGR